MSGHGAWQLAMERKRQAALCEKIAKAASRSLSEINKLEAAITQTNPKKYGELVSKLKNLENIQLENADNGIKEIEHLNRELSTVITQSQAELNNWAVEKQKLEAIWFETNQKLIELQEDPLITKESNFQNIIKLAEELKDEFQKKDVSKMAQIREEIFDASKKIQNKVIDESIRKQTVLDLIEILKSLNYEISQPKLQKMEDNTSQVVIQAKNSKGELISFRIELEGKTHIELNNFSQTVCRDKFDMIFKALEQKSGSDVKIEQWTWHNPDLIKKGAKNLPGSGPVQHFSAKK